MKNRKFSKSLFFLLGFSVIFLLEVRLSCGQVLRDFSQRTSYYSPSKKIYNIRGDFTMIGNTNLTLSNYGNSTNNSNNSMVYVDVDDDVNTLNSSSATLTLSNENGAIEECSNIIYAGLYWTGRAHDGNSPNSFSVTKDIFTGNMIETSVTDNNETVYEGEISHTTYSLNIYTSEGDNFFEFSSSGGGDMVTFRYDTGGNNVYVSVNNGAESLVELESYSYYNAYFENPYVIYSDTNFSLEVTRLRRLGTDRAYVNITYLESAPEVISVTKDFDKHVLQIKGPSASNYTTITANADDIYYPTNSNGGMYSAYAEITDYVKTHGLGSYTVADIALREGDGGGTGYYGGWGMVVVYENSKMDWRDVTIFDGHAYVASAAGYQELPVSGFNTAQSGDIGVKMGLMAGEGDVGITGDDFYIREHTDNNWVALSHDQNSSNNFFNSSIETGNNTRTPNLANNTGLDIAMFNIPNTNNSILTNSQTSTKFRYGSTQDTYIIYCIVFAVDAYVPNPEALNVVSSIGGSVGSSPPYSLFPGEEIEMTLTIKNKGSEAISNTLVEIPIPFNASYVDAVGTIVSSSYPPSNNVVTFNPSLGANGTIKWDLGLVPVPDDPDHVIAELVYKIKATEECNILVVPCGTLLSLNGTISGTGVTSGVTFSDRQFIQGYTEGGVCDGEPIYGALSSQIDASVFLGDNCAGVSQERIFTICDSNSSIPISQILGYFPSGSRFYSEYPVTSSTEEFTVNNPIPAVEDTLYAIPQGQDVCFFPFIIKIKTEIETPSITNQFFCEGQGIKEYSAMASEDCELLWYDSSSGGVGQVVVPQVDTDGQLGTFTKYVSQNFKNALGNCESERVAITITVNPNPNPNIIGEGEVCPNSSLTYSTSLISGNSYQWSVSGGVINGTNTGNSVSVIWGVLGEGSISVQETVTATECFKSVTKVVSIADNSLPVLSGCPSNISQGNDAGECSAVVSWIEPTALDNCTAPGSLVWSKSHTPGSTFAVGTTAVTYTATDAAGNTSLTCSFDVTVTDDEAPVLSGCPSNISQGNDAGECSAVVSWIEPTALDNCTAPGSLVWSKSHTPGSTFAVGTTAVTYTATDAAGNTSLTCSFDVTVTDDEAPVLSDCPSNISQGNDAGECSAVVSWIEPTASDNCTAPGSLVWSKSHTPGSTFAVGTTAVTYTATDAAGNTSLTCSFDVTVIDDEAPVLSGCPSNISQGNDAGECSAVVSWTEPTALDNCTAPGSLVWSKSHTPGSTFAVGTTAVTYTATDAAGNTSLTCSFDVTVTDDEAPVLSGCPSNISQGNDAGECSAVVSWIEPTASDNCTAPGSLVWSKSYTPGSTFAVGTTAVTYTATDAAGNTSLTCSFDVTVTDDEAPVLSGCPSNISQGNDAGECSAVVSWIEPTALDNCTAPGSLVWSKSHTPGSTFAVGTTAVTYTATDAAGNTSLTCSFDVTVTDDEAPVLSDCPSNISQGNDAGECSAVVSWIEPTASDNCTAPGSLVWSKSHTPGSTFAVGTTAVTYTATDAAGNTSLTCSFDVTVIDDEAPVLSGCPSNISQGNDAGECSAVVSWTEPTALDNCTAPGSLVWSKSHTPGSTFAVGTTAVTYTATDAAGNTSLTCSFDVTVTDDEAPVLSDCPSNISQGNDAGECSAVVSWEEPTALDNCTAPGSLVWSKSHTPGSTFAVGTTAVTYTATDAAGNTSLTCSFDVTVTDDEAPVLSDCPSNINQGNDAGECSAVVSWIEPTASDNCTAPGSLVWSKSHTPGSTFAVGTTAVTYTATDAAGNTSLTCSFDVTVIDDEAPVLSDCPSNISQGNDAGECSAVVSWIEPTASDNCTAPGSLVWSKSHTPGSTFAVGTTAVTYTATDAAGNTSLTCSFDVTVIDDEAPVLSDCPSNISQGNDAGECSAVVSWIEPTASDNCTAPGSLVWSKSHTPGSTFAVGTTAVTYTATDAAGNISLTCSFDVTVTDDEAPVLSDCPSNISQGNDAGECSAVVSWIEPTALDNCTAPGSLVWSKSHTPGSTFAVGTTAVTYTATDAAGNTSLTCSFDVTVIDDEAPVLSGCPSNISQGNDAGECSAVVSWIEPTALDNCTAPGSLVWSKSHTPGSTFAVGTTAVTYTATDAAGNTSLTCSFDVTVTDDEAPVLSDCPSNISQGNDAGECSAVVSWIEPTASDNCTAPGSLVWSKSHTPGSTFAVGTTAVTYTATDAAGNTSLTCSFDVTVIDDEAPVLSGCPSNISQGNDAGECSAVVSWTEPTALDNCTAPGSLVWSKSHTPGSTFAVGTTAVTYTATDAAGNTSLTCSFDVTVIDDEAPVLSGCPSNISQGNDAGECSAVVSWTEPTALDNCTAPGSLVWSKSHTPGSTFAVGTTAVTYTATDAAGNTSLTCSFDVTVTDDEAPVLSDCPSNISQGNDAGECSAVVSWEEPTALDNCTAPGSLVWSKSHTPGSTFAVGTTAVTYTATDAAGNTSLTCSFDVTVTDDEAPVLSDCPSNINQGNDAGECSAVVSWIEPTASDNCTAPGSLVWSKSHTPGSTFAVGTTAVTYTATDAAGNTSLTCSFDVTVIDDEAPVLSDCPSNISQGNDAGECSAVVSWIEPTASDNCTAPGSLVWSKSHTPGSTFAVGTTAVTYTATDAAGNTSLTCSFDVTVTDDEAPVLSDCPSNISQGNDAGECSAVVSWIEPTASDNCTAPGSLVWSKSHTPGSTFAVGTTAVTYTATDAAGNTSLTCSFDVTVIDDEAPVLSGCPSNISQGNDAGECSAVVSWTEPTALDNCTAPGSLVWSKSHTPGSTFAVGTTAVTYTATDAAGNTSLTCSFDVTVTDDEAPVLSGCPSNISQGNDAGECSAVVSWIEPTASDNCTAPGSLVWSKSHTPGSTFAVGTTAVTYTATDAAGNTSLTCSFDVTVTDDEAPVLSGCPSNISQGNDAGECSAVVSWIEPTALDNCTAPGSLVWSKSHTPGSTFAVGTTAVTYTATDAAGNTSLTCSFDVTVTDDEAPVLSDCPSNISQGNDAGECSAVVSWIEPTASDNCTAPGSLVWSKSHTPGSTFAVGTTAVTYTATDAAGNTSLTCSFDVTVIDDEAPVLSGCPSNISQGNDAGECSAVVSWTEPTALDNCTAPGSLVWSKSHTPGSTFAVGTTAVTYTATDAAGNTSLTCSFDVTVTDDEAPVLSDCPSNISQGNDAGECSAVVSWIEPTASDNCTAPGSLVWSKSHTPGSTFAVGTTAVTYTATDAAGNTSLTCSFDVTVTDDEAPTITCGNTIEKTIQSNASCTSYIEVPVPEVNDNCGIASIENNINGSSDASGDYSGGETVIEWTVTDYGGNSKTCEQLIIVHAIPSAFDDADVTAEDTPTTIAVLANDVDCDNNIDLNTLTITSGPAHGNVNITSNGGINYTPDKNYAGTDFFSYRICDEDEQCDEANVTITVRSQNDPPVAVDDLNNTFVDTNVGGNVLTNDYDIDGNSLSVAIAGNPSHGSVVLNSNGDYTYSPAAGYLGEDHFSYQLRDGHGGTSTAEVFITIISDHAMSNQPPVANEDVYVGKMNTSIIGNVLKNDYDPDGDPLTLNTNLVAQPSEGTIQINADGSFIYSPKTNYSGQISFTYQVCDDGDPVQCNTAQVILIIDRNSNDNSTVAVDDAFFTKVNNTLTANVVGNDYDPEGHSTTVSLIGQALHGDVVLNANGSFSYTPDTDYIGPDHFTYRSCDQGSPTACDQATVYINVSEVNHPPVAVDDWFGRDGTAANILLNDYDPDGDELVLNTTPVVSVQHGTLIINADGSFSYTPEQLYFEQDSFTYQVCDNALVPLCDEATVIIYVDSDNDGVANVFDIDDDNDGILDIVEGDKAVDTDNDGVPDSLDIDSDNDGIPDNLESQHAEDYVAPSGADADGDGWDDAYDNDNGGTPIVIVDTDGDGIGDYLDLDSDNDGIIDAIEGNDSNHDGVADSIATGVDSDGDGLDDAYDTVNNKSSTATNALGSNVIMGNSDGDEVPDWRDIDSDNDGIVDSVEGQDSQLAYVAPTGNDSDGDGLDDAYDPDVGGIQVGVVDTDSDGIPDYLDEDSDNDLVPDFVEGQDLNKDGQPDHEFMGLDADGDGLDNSNDTSDDVTRLENPMGTNVPLADSDGDGIPDWRDTDDDGDGLQTASKEDWNEDGDPTNDDCNYNGIPNYLDEESCDLLIPDAFSPNGDGINDHFRIRGMYKYPNAKIEIYNRWGAVVYTKENYGNITMYGDPDAWWDGRANSKGTSGSEILPTGTYFVVLILENSFVHKGIVYINR